MNNKIIVEKLLEEYDDAICGLDYTSSLQLTIALILAAQCTDKRVNEIIPILFSKYPTINDLNLASTNDIKSIIKPCGFYNSKAKSIKETVYKIIHNFNSKVPNTMNDLLTLTGIGRKSANIILAECYNIIEGIAVDTHVSRVSYRLGLTKSNIPLIQEKELMKKIAKKHYSKINHVMVYHGRKICDARKPKCEMCFLNQYCKFYLKNIK